MWLNCQIMNPNTERKQAFLRRLLSCSSEDDDQDLCRWHVGPNRPQTISMKEGSLEYYISYNNTYLNAIDRLLGQGFNKSSQEVQRSIVRFNENRVLLDSKIYSIISALTRTLITNVKTKGILAKDIWEFFRYLGVSKDVVKEVCARYSFKLDQDKVKEMIIIWVKLHTNLATESRIDVALMRLDEDHPGLKLKEHYDEYCYFAETVDQGVQTWEQISLGHKLIKFSHCEIQRITNEFSQRVDCGGSFGEVYKGVYQGLNVAVKDCRHISEDSTQNKFCKIQFDREQSVAKLRHPFVIPVVGFCETIVNDKHHLSLVYIYMEKGDLSKQVALPEFTTYHRLKVLYQCAHGLRILHREHILHRDVKLRNILLDNAYNARIADTGSSRPITDGESHLTSSNMGGTTYYTDPSIFWYLLRHGKPKFHKENDIYSFGVVIAQVITFISTQSEELLKVLRHVYHKEINEEDFYRQLKSLTIIQVWSSDVLMKLLHLVWQCVQPMNTRVKLQDVCNKLQEMCTSERIELFEDCHQYCVCCLVNARPNTSTSLLYPVTNDCNKQCIEKLCTDCMKNHHNDELHCPNHGPMQSCIGHANSIAILLAGPGKRMRIRGGGNDVDIAFDINAFEMVKMLTDKNCFNLRKENVYLLHPERNDITVDGINSLQINRGNLKKFMAEIKEKSDVFPNTTLMLFCWAHTILKEVLVDGKKCLLHYITGCKGDKTFLEARDPKKDIPITLLRKQLKQMNLSKTWGFFDMCLAQKAFEDAMIYVIEPSIEGNEKSLELMEDVLVKTVVPEEENLREEFEDMVEEAGEEATTYYENMVPETELVPPNSHLFGNSFVRNSVVMTSDQEKREVDSCFNGRFKRLNLEDVDVTNPTPETFSRQGVTKSISRYSGSESGYGSNIVTPTTPDQEVILPKGSGRIVRQENTSTKPYNIDTDSEDENTPRADVVTFKDSEERQSKTAACLDEVLNNSYYHESLADLEYTSFPGDNEIACGHVNLIPHGMDQHFMVLCSSGRDQSAYRFAGNYILTATHHLLNALKGAPECRLQSEEAKRKCEEDQRCKNFRKCIVGDGCISANRVTSYLVEHVKLDTKCFEGNVKEQIPRAMGIFQDDFPLAYLPRDLL